MDTSQAFMKSYSHLPFNQIQTLYQTYLINHVLDKTHTMECDNDMLYVMTQPHYNIWLMMPQQNQL